MFAPVGGAAKARRRSSKKGDWTPILPVPENAPAAPAVHYSLGKPSAKFAYRGPDEELLGYVLRFDTGPGAKEFWPLTFCENAGTGKREWRWRSWDVPRPLYGLDRISADVQSPVIVVEGEKAADVVQKLVPGYIGVTSPGGSKGAGTADWGPLAGRQVVVWPDADDPGRDYAVKVARALAGVGAAPVTLVTPPKDVAPGFDAADALAEGWDMLRARELIQDARPLEEAFPGESPSGGRRRGPPQRENVIELVGDIELWHGRDGDAFATVQINGHRENWAVRSRQFEIWLSGEYHAAHGVAVGGQALRDCLRVIEAEAIYDGAEHGTFSRIGRADGVVYVDLGGRDWRSVKITGEGWEIIEQAPVKFLRSPQMRALPVPEPGGRIDRLREFVNAGNDETFVLIVGWLIGAFNPAGPYPLLVIGGEQGSAKSTMARAVRALVDPNATLVRTVPRDERDLVVAARNSWVLSYDNISSVPVWFSDALCRLSTGGGFGCRELYSDSVEFVFEGQRPVILNGIGDLAARPDLADRAIVITLPPIADIDRRTDSEWKRNFDDAAPEIFGAVLDGVAAAVGRAGEIELPTKPRMADSVVWVTAAEPGLGWPEGVFLSLYAANRDEAVQASLDADPIAQAILALLGNNTYWQGSPSELLATLEPLVPDTVKRGRHWPTTAGLLSRRLTRAAPILRVRGIVFERAKGGKDSRRVITLQKTVEPEKTPGPG